MSLPFQVIETVNESRATFEEGWRILVKVIDIFGNDTSQAFDVEVK